jgi:hypothetical protein
MPHELVNLKTGEVGEREAGLGSSLAEVGTLQLELSALSMATGDLRFRYRSEHVMDFIGSLLVEEGGLLPIMLRPQPPIHWTNWRVTLGGRGDSFYEYLLKQWLMTNRTEEKYRTWYQTFVGAIQKAFVGTSSPSNITFVREVDSLNVIKAHVGSEGKRWQPQEALQAVAIDPMTFIMQVQQTPDAQNKTAKPALENVAENSSDASSNGKEEVDFTPEESSDGHKFLQDLIRQTMQAVQDGTLEKQIASSAEPESVTSDDIQEGTIDASAASAHSTDSRSEETVEGDW